MAMTIGRVGLDVAVDQVVEDFSMQGDRLTLKGDLWAASVTDAKALRQQLLGYVDNPDEDFLPVTWSDDQNIDGYYYLTGAEVGSYPGRASLGGGLFPFSVDLERVSNGYAAPLFESVLTGALLVNSNAIIGTAARPFHALPNSHLNYSTGIGSTVVSSRVGADPDGSAVTLTYYNALTSAGPGSGVFSANPTWWLPPANWYDGACTFEIAENIFLPRAMVGRQVMNKPGNWRLENGLVRVDSAANAVLSISWHDGTQWEPAKTFQVYATGIPVAWNAVTVLRNDPAQVTIRLGITPNAALDPQLQQVDISLKRGDRIVRCYAASTLTPTNWEIRSATAEAGTAITGGVRATANDANGNRYVLISSTPSTVNAATGRLANVPVDDVTFDFGIGLEVGGTGATSPSTAADLVNAYHAAQSERVLVVAR